MSPALTGGFFTTSATWEARVCVYKICIFGTQHRTLTMRQKRYVGKRFATSGDGGTVHDSGQ